MDDFFGWAFFGGSSTKSEEAKFSKNNPHAFNFNLLFGAFHGRFSQSVAANSSMLRRLN